jgi:rhodanese-related sulfurtransferase
MKILIILVVLIIGWDMAWYFAGVSPLLPWQLERLLKESKKTVSLIDVRTPEEYNWFHIEGASNIPLLRSDKEVFKTKDFAEPVVVICMTGHRSPMVAYRLKKLGYKQIYNLTWGMVAWKLFRMTND